MLKHSMRELSECIHFSVVHPASLNYNSTNLSPWAHLVVTDLRQAGDKEKERKMGVDVLYIKNAGVFFCYSLIQLVIGDVTD